MSLTSNISKTICIGNGAAKVFSFAFKVWAENQVKVYMLESGAKIQREATAETTVKISDTGGTVTFAEAPPDGARIVIVRNMPFLQEDAYINGTRFDPHVIEERLDVDCAERQQLKEGMGRALLLPETSAETQQEFLTRLFSVENASEAAQAGAEAAQNAAETAQAGAEAAQAGAEAAQAGAEAAQAGAEAAQANAETAKTEAQAAQEGAEAAQAGAEAAQAGAEAAQNAAETAQAGAEAAQNAAETKLNTYASLTAEASTLAEGSAATAVFDAVSGKITFGIPKGDTGTIENIDSSLSSESEKPVQNKAVTAALAAETEAREAAVANCLPLSGGTLTGTVNINSTPAAGWFVPDISRKQELTLPATEGSVTAPGNGWICFGIKSSGTNGYIRLGTWGGSQFADSMSTSINNIQLDVSVPVVAKQSVYVYYKGVAASAQYFLFVPAKAEIE